MDKIDFENKWPVIRSQSKIWWSLITDADLERVDQADDKLIEYMNILQLKYSLGPQVAKGEIIQNLKDHESIADVKDDTVDPR